MAKQEMKEKCTCNRFPVLKLIILVLAVLWLLADWGVINANIPWFPLIVAVLTVGMIIKHYMWCSCRQ